MMFSEMLPNVMPPMVVEATMRLGYAIFAVATLGFLGSDCAAVAGLGGADHQYNTLIRIRVVDDALPRPRDRHPRRRGQPRPGRFSRRSSDEPKATSTLELSDLELVYRVRGRDRQVLRGISFEIGRGRVVRPRGRVGMWQVHGGAGDRPLPGAERAA